MANSTIYQSRLSQLMAEAGISLASRVPDMPMNLEPASFRSHTDESTAEQVLRATKEQSLEATPTSATSKLFRSKTKRLQYSYKDISATLSSVVENNGSAGVAEILVEKLMSEGGDVNLARRATTNKIKSWKGLNKVDERNHILRIAVEHGNYGMTQLLLRQADQSSKDEALEASLKARNIPLTELLLRHGANAESFPREFTALVEEGKWGMVSVILKCQKPVSLMCATECLEKAVVTGVLDTVLALVDFGADGGFREASALKIALRGIRKDIAMAIITSTYPPSQSPLDECMDIVAREIHTDLDSRLWLMEMLLCAGATGSRALVSSTAQGNLMMMKLLVQYNTSIEFEQAAALKDAIRRSNVEQVSVLLGTQKTLAANLASAAFALIDSGSSRETQISLASMLLDRGACGIPLDEALIQAVRVDFLEAINLLIDSQRLNTASIYYKDSQALRDAVSRQKIVTLNLLMKGAVSAQSLAKAFPHIRSADKNNRLEMTRMFLEKGASGDEVNIALQEAVMDQSQDRDERLIALLVQKGADVSYNVGTKQNPLLAVARQGDINALKLLLQGRPSRETISSAVVAAMTLVESANRMKIVQILLEAGAFGVHVANALVIATMSYTDDEPLIKLLLRDGKADVNYNEGEAVVEAVKKNARTLALIVNYGSPNADSIKRSLQCAMELDPLYLDSSNTLEILLKRGKPPDALAYALVRGVQTIQGLSPKPFGIIRSLLSAGADVNYQNGSALEIAIRAVDLISMDLLLARKPAVTTINGVFHSAILIDDLRAQEQVYQRLILAGASGREVSKALPAAVKAGPHSHSILQLLLPKSSVDFENGAALCCAVTHYNREQFVLLMNYQPSVESLNFAFAVAAKSRNTDKKYELFQLLLQSGAKGDVVAKALITESQHQEQRLTKLLLDYNAPIDFNHGAALVASVKASNPSLLKLFVTSSSKPLLSSLNFAFVEAMLIKNSEVQYEIYVILLEAGMEGESLDMALLAATKTGLSAKATCALLLQFQASSNYLDGACVNIATISGSVEILELLLTKGNPSQSTLSRAFDSSFKLKREERLKSTALILDAGLNNNYENQVNSKLLSETKKSTPDHQYLRLLLEQNASVHFENNACLLNAAKTRDHKTLEVLVEFLQESSDASKVLVECEKDGGLWRTTDGCRVLEILLEKGAAGPTLDTLLVQTISEYDSHPSAPLFIKKLLQHHADINFQEGMSLQIAATKHNYDLLVSLLQHNPKSTSLSLAFPNILSSKANERTVIKLVKLFTDHIGDHALDVSFEHPDFEPILILSLIHYPRSSILTRTLLQAGYYVDKMVRWQFNEQFGDENASLLCWCLAQPEKQISDSVIEVLIEEGANVNFSTQSSNVTPLTLAVASGRSRIVSKLLESNVDVNPISTDGISPLTRACRLGDIDLMDRLVAAGADTDDGSLHEAARNLRPDAIVLLMRAGHNTEFPSTKHEGRSALAELCSKCSDSRSPTTAAHEQLVKRSIKTLIDCGANIRFRHHGKSLLLIALDSASPFPVTKALLDLTWESINDKVHLYTFRGYTYSALTYMEKGQARSPRSTHSGLFKLLKDKGATKVYFADKPPQPPDYDGAPQHIIDAQERWEAEKEKNRRIEEDHLRRLRHKEEISTQFMAQSDREHRLKLDQENQRTQAHITNLEATARTQLQVSENHERQAATFSQHRRRAEIEHARQIGQTQLDIKGREAQLQLEHKKSVARIEAADRRDRDETLRREHDRRVYLVGMEEGSSQRGYERNLKMVEMQRNGVREQRRLVESQRELAGVVTRGMGAQAGNQNQRAIGYIEEA